MTQSPQSRNTATTPVPDISRIPMREHLTLTFPTPVLVYPWPDSDALNDALRDQVLTAERAGPGIAKSNVGGWHSDLDLLSWDGDSIRTLMARIEAAIIELTGFFLAGPGSPQPVRFRAEAWANVLRAGQYNNLHNHADAHWSGVYYVTGNPTVAGRPMSGKLEFVDPRPAATMVVLDNNKLYGRQMLNPVAGTMVVFPSWLQHQVHPYFGPDERISISFNVVLSQPDDFNPQM